MKYPKDNFYSGHSLSFDLDRSGKDEYEQMQSKLLRYGYKPSPKLVQTSLQTLQGIHKHIKQNCGSDVKGFEQYERKQKITGSVIPGDIFLAEQAFEFLVNNYPSILLAGSTFTSILKNVLGIIRRRKKKNVVEKRVDNIITKLLKNKKNKVIIKNVIEIRLSEKKSKRKKSTKKSKKQKVKKQKTKRSRKKTAKK